MVRGKAGKETGTRRPWRREENRNPSAMAQRKARMGSRLVELRPPPAAAPGVSPPLHDEEGKLGTLATRADGNSVEEGG